MIAINPRVDFIFKKLFGSEENKDLLINLINSIVSPEDQVTDLIIKNPYNAKNFKNDKLTILDIKAQDSKGKWFNIEMQIVDQEYYEQRALYYWSRLYTEQLASGINYDSLKKTIGINILNFNCLAEPDYHNIYHIRNDKSKNLFFDQFEIHFVELEKYDNQQISSFLDRWVTFLKKAGEYDRNRLPKELEEVPAIRRAIEILETMSMDDDERDIYEGRLKWLRDEEMALKKAEKRGREEGLAEGMMAGLEEGKRNRELEIARNMKKAGMTYEAIQQLTGLTEDEF